MSLSHVFLRARFHGFSICLHKCGKLTFCDVTSIKIELELILKSKILKSKFRHTGKPDSDCPKLAMWMQFMYGLI